MLLFLYFISYRRAPKGLRLFDSWCIWFFKIKLNFIVSIINYSVVCVSLNWTNGCLSLFANLFDVRNSVRQIKFEICRKSWHCCEFILSERRLEGLVKDWACSMAALLHVWQANMRVFAKLCKGLCVCVPNI